MSRLTRTTAYVWATVALVPSLLLGTGCGDDPVPPPVKNPAKILSFTSDRATVPSGTRVTLSWRVQDATSVTIGSPDGVLVNASAEQMGTVMSAELTRQTTFTITAVGAGGNAMNTVTVSIEGAPADAQISTFTASMMTVPPGGNVTLQWTTMNAASISLSAQPTGGAAVDVIAPGSTRINDEETVQPMVTTTYVLTAKGASGPDATRTITVVVEGVPVIVSFGANPQAIELGGMSTLSWEVTGATTVRITDAAGNEVYSGTEGTGTQVVAPTQSTAYTLTASVSATNGVSSSPVMVTVNRAAIVTSFTANPSTIDYGDTSELRWVVERATGISIATVGGQVVHTSSAAMGAFTVTTTVTTTYVLTALNVDGNTTAMATVTVNPIAPRVVRFDASPNPARITEQSTLAWNTIGATSVRITDPTGTSIYSGTDANGTIAVTVTATLAQYTLEATNPNGSTTQTVQLVGQFDPIITSLGVAPTFFIGTATTATVTWSTTDATSTSLTINGVAAVGFPGTATGTFTFTTTTTARVVLTAINAIGQATREVLVARMVDGTIDTGRTASTAIALGNAPGAIGVIAPPGGPAGDLDYYTVVVPEGGNITIEIGDGRGGCPFDSFVTLFGPDGTTSLGTDDDDSPAGVCSLISPTRDAFAVNMAAGTYYIQVRGFNNTPSGTVVDYGRYVLSVSVRAPACGNGFNESRAAEQCDDANTVAGDGCSATCQVEPLATVMGPGASQTVGGAITPAGNADFVRIDMLAAGYIAAEIFIPSRGRCDAATGSADPVLTLFDANFVSLGSDDNDGIASCSRIDPTVDAFSLVQAGTYYLRVTESGNDGVIGAYVLDVRTLGQGCGNAVQEGAEECDDGNTLNGDGCNQTCEFEGLREVEPNGTFATATLVQSTTTSFIVRGAITPAADLDFFLIDVPAGYHVDAYATVNSLTDCPESPEATVGLYSTTGTLQGSVNSTGGPQGNCGRVWPYTVTQSRAMAGGRYGIRVAATSGTIGTYFLHVNLIAPGCGNRIIEGAEQCEDGNGVSGDGCSATCTFEPYATLDLTVPGTSTITASINPEFNRDAIRLVVTTTTTYLFADTYLSAATRTCPSPLATRMLLFSDTGTLLGENVNDGVGECSNFDPRFDDFAVLEPGSYWLVVEELGNNAIVPTYDIVIRSAPRNFCGNLIAEPDAGEQCDGETFCNRTTCQIATRGTVVGPAGSMTFSEAITPIGDLDFFAVNTSTNAYVVVETGIPTIGTCASGDTIVRLFDAATGVELFTDDDDGLGLCSYQPGIVGPAPRVPAGNYFVRVEEYQSNAAIAAYQIRIDVITADICGNGFPERAETCDDGNTTAGDGCSATCTTEPTHRIAGPAAPQVFSDSIAAFHQYDYYQLDLAVPSLVIARTGAPTIGVCTSPADTTIRLYDATRTLLVTDDNSGLSSRCSLINGVAASAARVPAGRYYIRVEESGDDAALGPYQLEVETRPLNACGNGVAETGEFCDDGNTTNGDGCSSVCQSEIPISNATETEANNTPQTANTLGTIGAAGIYIYQAAVPALGDVDFYTFTLTAPLRVQIATHTNQTATNVCATIDTQLWLYNAIPANITTTSATTEPTIVEYDDDDNFGASGIGACSRISGTTSTPTRRTLQPGTYYVQARMYNNNSTGNYFLTFDFLP